MTHPKTQQMTNQNMEFLKTQKLITQKMIEYMAKYGFITLPMNDKQMEKLIKGEF